MRKRCGYSIADAVIIDKLRRSNTTTYLDKIDAIVDWQPIEAILEKRYRWTKSATGNPAYPPLKLFKALLVQRWEKLTDPQMEFALRDRFSLMRFVGFGVGDDTPDHSTLCRFRKRLSEIGIYQELFEEINRQMLERGLMVKERKEVVVDATVVETYSRPKKVLKNMPEDRNEDKAEGEGNGESQIDPPSDIQREEGVEKEEREEKEEIGEIEEEAVTTTSYQVEYCKDPDARWLKKGKKSYLGYKCFVGVDTGGFILGVHMEPANVSEVTKLKEVVEVLGIGRGWSLLADKGYASAENRRFLRDQGIDEWIMEKRVKGQWKLEWWQKIKNRLISESRYVVEQVFGLLKRHYEFKRLRYITLEKALMEGLLVSMAYNLKKAAGMVVV